VGKVGFWKLKSCGSFEKKMEKGFLFSSFKGLTGNPRFTILHPAFDRRFMVWHQRSAGWIIDSTPTSRCTSLNHRPFGSSRNVTGVMRVFHWFPLIFSTFLLSIGDKAMPRACAPSCRWSSTVLTPEYNVQARGNNQNIPKNKDDDIVRDEPNGQKIENVAPGDRAQSLRARKQFR
ncbi:hypothetical protein HAX54_002273, partial [Datura stramonium]|nr:hypothetical protein [Datura stramonium]